jgi:hypothetical protein
MSRHKSLVYVHTTQQFSNFYKHATQSCSGRGDNAGKSQWYAWLFAMSGADWRVNETLEVDWYMDFNL